MSVLWRLRLRGVVALVRSDSAWLWVGFSVWVCLDDA